MTNRSTVIPSLGGETHQLRDNNLSYAGFLSSKKTTTYIVTGKHPEKNAVYL